jgi:asparagine synthase (glutamine-hydrolysing)
MCGIAGFLAPPSSTSSEGSGSILYKMGTVMRSRGPDDHGEWHEVESGIGLCHRRLSILDLSAAGHQPMVSRCGRFVLVFNGEIYNHARLRKCLVERQGIAGWRGSSDTETLLAGIACQGLDATLQTLEGMFAFALWDRELRTLTLGRDRLGEKPLYYGWQQGHFLFGSELKALRQHPAFLGGVDKSALTLYLRHNYVPAPFSIHPGIRKLMPGTTLSVSWAEKEPSIKKYWSVEDAIRKKPNDAILPMEAVNELDTLLKSVISDQLVADVPVGAFLSGGVDSSAVVAIMQSVSQFPIKTFSIGFDEQFFDEAPHAKAIANHLGTDHHELYVTGDQAMAVIPKLPEIYDEPFADSSQIPTFLVAQLAREDVAVALSGDGGDEVFCGYNRYLLADQLWGRMNLIPNGIRRSLGKAITLIPPGKWDALISPIAKMTATQRRLENVGDKLHKFSGILDSSSLDDLYYRLVSIVQQPSSLVLDSEEPTGIRDLMASFDGLDDISKMMALDLATYLPDDNLVKVDRAAMANSLETRVPLLNHKVVEFGCALPLSYKLSQGRTKWILREVLYRYVPRDLIERPKMGFGVPIEVWLRGPLKGWAEDLLYNTNLAKECGLDMVKVRTIWTEHVSGRRNFHHSLWGILMYLSWFDFQNRSIN